MNTREAINQAVSFFVNVQRCENPSETDIRLALNDLVDKHDYAQAWAVRQVKARLRKYREAIGSQARSCPSRLESRPHEWGQKV